MKNSKSKTEAPTKKSKDTRSSEEFFTEITTKKGFNVKSKKTGGLEVTKGKAKFKFGKNLFN